GVLPAGNFHDEDVGLDQSRLSAIVFLAGTRIEVLDDLDGFHNLVKRPADRLGNFLELLVLKLVQVLADDLRTDLIVLTDYPKLNKQALTDISRGNTWRVECLHNLERLLDVFQRVFAAFGNLFKSNLNFPS